MRGIVQGRNNATNLDTTHYVMAYRYSVGSCILCIGGIMNQDVITFVILIGLVGVAMAIIILASGG